MDVLKCIDNFVKNGRLFDDNIKDNLREFMVKFFDMKFWERNSRICMEDMFRLIDTCLICGCRFVDSGFRVLEKCDVKTCNVVCDECCKVLDFGYDANVMICVIQPKNHNIVRWGYVVNGSIFALMSVTHFSRECWRCDTRVRTLGFVNTSSMKCDPYEFAGIVINNYCCFVDRYKRTTILMFVWYMGSCGQDLLVKDVIRCILELIYL